MYPPSVRKALMGVRAVGTAGLSAYVAHYGEPWQVAGHLRGQAVGETLVEASQASRCAHIAPSFSRNLSAIFAQRLFSGSPRGQRLGNSLSAVPDSIIARSSSPKPS